MRTIGLLGGMSWESSLEYYRIVNEAVRERLGGFHSAPCVLWSVDFGPIEALQRAGEWDAAGDLLAARAKGVEAAGAELLVLCTNTMHRVADAVEAAVSIPLLHIGDVVAAAVRAAGVDAVGLLGTAFTMEQPFLRERLERWGVRVLVPDDPDRAEVHRVIYGELVMGDVRSASRERYRSIMQKLLDRGAGGIIYGCTEIELLVGPDDCPAPTFPTTRLHALAAVDAALTPAS